MKGEKIVSLNSMRANASAAEGLLKCMANASRLMILCQLVEGAKCVSELQATLDLSQSALSQHLAKLRQLGLVKTRKQGLNVYYHIKDQAALVVLKALYQIYCQ